MSAFQSDRAEWTGIITRAIDALVAGSEQSRETVVAQGDSARFAIDCERKTAPGVASTNTGSLDHSEAVDNGRTCIT